MNNVIEFLRTDMFLIIISIVVVFMFIGILVAVIKNIQLEKKYKKFMKKLGNGKNLEEDLENYMYRVDRVEKQNAEITNFCKSLDEDMAKCVQKIGIIRYSAFKDTGSDLSFALALLDEKNDGIVLNGIYSREISNIYAKPVKNGNSTYTLSEEESKAINQAIESNNLYKMR